MTSKAKSTLGVVKPSTTEPVGEVVGKEEVEEVGGEPRKEIVWQKDSTRWQFFTQRLWPPRHGW